MLSIQRTRLALTSFNLEFDGACQTLDKSADLTNLPLQHDHL